MFFAARIAFFADEMHVARDVHIYEQKQFFVVHCFCNRSDSKTMRRTLRIFYVELQVLLGTETSLHGLCKVQNTLSENPSQTFELTAFEVAPLRSYASKSPC